MPSKPPKKPRKSATPEESAPSTPIVPNALAEAAFQLASYRPPQGVPELSSVLPAGRPTPIERAVDERARRFTPTEGARDWFEDAWSDKAIAARMKRAPWPKARGEVPPGYERVPVVADSELGCSAESLTYARLVQCVAALTDASVPTGATVAERKEHAERVVYVHRLCTDPDLDYRGEPFRGPNRRETVLGFLRLVAAQGNQRGRTLQLGWYGLVDWALSILAGREAEAAQAAAPAEAREPKIINNNTTNNTFNAPAQYLDRSPGASAEMTVAPESPRPSWWKWLPGWLVAVLKLLGLVS